MSNSMSMRRFARIVFGLVILVVLWTRFAPQWHDRSGLWLFGMLTLSVLLLLVVIVEATGVQQKWRKLRDQVPKKPLGLDT